jgi:hypothetical protein
MYNARYITVLLRSTVKAVVQYFFKPQQSETPTEEQAMKYYWHKIKLAITGAGTGFAGTYAPMGVAYGFDAFNGHTLIFVALCFAVLGAVLGWASSSDKEDARKRTLTGEQTEEDHRKGSPVTSTVSKM